MFSATTEPERSLGQIFAAPQQTIVSKRKPVVPRPGRRGPVLEFDAGRIDRGRGLGLHVRINSDRHHLVVPSIDELR
jgi:hypothetical protein